MRLKDIATTFNNDIMKLEPVITGRKFAHGICAAAAAGVIVGILITHRSRKKIREDIKNRASKTTITIEVRDLERLLRERIE